jgi:hypothetical protein
MKSHYGGAPDIVTAVIEAKRQSVGKIGRGIIGDLTDRFSCERL